MKNIKYIVSIGILLILNGILIYKHSSYSKVLNSVSTVLNRTKQELLTFTQNFTKEQENESLVLDKNLEFIDVEGNVIQARDLFKSNTIVLRYSESNCKDCIDAEINNLIANKDKLNRDIILIAHYRNKRDLFVYYKEFQKKGLDKVKMYFLADNDLNIPIEKINAPFYFFVNSNLAMSNFFIPQKDKPKLSETYLKFALKDSIKD